MTAGLGVVAVIVQVRITSMRLAGKVLMPLSGVPLMRRGVERLARIEGVDKVTIAYWPRVAPF